MSVTFGIYLGNSSCCVAVNRNKNTDVVANPAGERVTPAVVSFHEDEVVTGLPAKQGLIRNGGNAVVGVLRSLYADSEEDLIFPLNHKCKVVWEKNTPKYSLQFGDRFKLIPVKDALHHIFKMLKDIASSHSNTDELPVVITLPTWLNESSISLVQNVALSVGFNVLSVISQPSALALAYDLLNDNKENFNTLILHCGGSSVLATVIEISGGLLTIRESSVFSSVAGDSLTLVLVDHFAKEFYTRYKGDPLENRRSKRKLYNASETCKHVLSTVNTAQVHVESLWEGVDFSTQLSRARFDGLVLSTLNEFLSPVKEVLERCSLSNEQISKVILSGGSCKIPKLQQIVCEHFPKAQILKQFPPDEALAVGAANEAALIHGNGFFVSSPHNALITLLSTPIYACLEPKKESSVLVFPRSTPTHARNSVQFDCPKYPASLLIYESSEPCETPLEEQILAQVDLNFNENCANQVQVDFSIKSDGSLNVKVHDPTSKSARSFAIEAER